LEAVDWQPPPMVRRARNVELARCGPGVTVYGWCVSDQVVEMFFHWDGGEGTPHLKDKAKCFGCRQGLGFRRKGYFAMLLSKQPQVVIVEVSDHCIQRCALLSNKNSHLRGRQVTIKRIANKKNGRETKKSRIEAVWGPMPAPSILPRDFDIRPSLGLIFGLIPTMFGETRDPNGEGGDA
jgi:hypothetical protein